MRNEILNFCQWFKGALCTYFEKKRHDPDSIEYLDSAKFLNPSLELITKLEDKQWNWGDEWKEYCTEPPYFIIADHDSDRFKDILECGNTHIIDTICTGQAGASIIEVEGTKWARIGEIDYSYDDETETKIESGKVDILNDLFSFVFLSEKGTIVGLRFYYDRVIKDFKALVHTATMPKDILGKDPLNNEVLLDARKGVFWYSSTDDNGFSWRMCYCGVDLAPHRDHEGYIQIPTEEIYTI